MKSQEEREDAFVDEENDDDEEYRESEDETQESAHSIEACTASDNEPVWEEKWEDDEGKAFKNNERAKLQDNMCTANEAAGAQNKGVLLAFNEEDELGKVEEEWEKHTTLCNDIEEEMGEELLALREKNLQRVFEAWRARALEWKKRSSARAEGRDGAGTPYETKKRTNPRRTATQAFK